MAAGREGRRSEARRAGDGGFETPGSPAQNGKRTRKFGVVSRSSSNRDSVDSRDSELENGTHSPGPPAPGDPRPLGEGREEGDTRANTLPHAKGAPGHLQNGGAATLPTRSGPLERKTGSVSSEPPSQVGLRSAFC